MKEYIERDRARFEFERFFKEQETVQHDCDSLLCMLPAADVVERKRGEWIKVGESCGVDLLECPVCHTIHAQDGDAFCRDCGADMRGEKHE